MKRWILSAALAAATLTSAAPAASAQAPVRASLSLDLGGAELVLASHGSYRYRSSCGPRYRYDGPSYRSYRYGTFGRYDHRPYTYRRYYRSCPPPRAVPYCR